MKIVELLSKVKLPLNNEQADLLGRFHDREAVFKEHLDDREQMVANRLTELDVLTRRQNEQGKIFYKKKIRN